VKPLGSAFSLWKGFYFKFNFANRYRDVSLPISVSKTAKFIF
jgi:hypothetical protein